MIALCRKSGLVLLGQYPILLLIRNSRILGWSSAAAPRLTFAGKTLHMEVIGLDPQHLSSAGFTTSEATNHPSPWWRTPEAAILSMQHCHHKNTIVIDSRCLNKCVCKWQLIMPNQMGALQNDSFKQSTSFILVTQKVQSCSYSKIDESI